MRRLRGRPADYAQNAFRSLPSGRRASFLRPAAAAVRGSESAGVH